MYQILLVEDDLKICDVINTYFLSRSDNQLKLNIIHNGNDALNALYENQYDLVLLDIMLPGADGFQICKSIRENNATPIIFLTARGLEEDILRGYDLGCDDYIVKPFSLATLYAKVNALLNRTKGTVINNELTAGNVKLNPRSMNVYLDGNVIDLPHKEFLILKVLLENKGAVVSRDNLIVRIWGYDYDGDERILDNHIKKLRNALGKEGSRIKTVIRRGYKIID